MSFQGTPPRYLNPPAEKPKHWPLPEKERIPANPQFQGVHARYMDPKEAPQPQNPMSRVPPSPFHDPKAHEALARANGFGGVGSRYRDELNKKEDGLPSPREIVEYKKSHGDVKLVKGWRSAGTRTPKHFTFDTLRRVTEARLQQLKPKKPQGQSSVKEYIKSGTPIKHHIMSHAPPPRREDENQLPKWHAAGVSQTNFTDHHKKSLAARATQYGEDRVREQREKLKEAKVPKNYTPRVAKLAPAYQIAQMSPAPRAQSASSTLRRSQSKNSGGGGVSPDPANGNEQHVGFADETLETEEGNNSPPPQHEEKEEIPLKWTLTGRPVF